MELLSAGRDCDVYALDDHRVVRRYRRSAGRTAEREARLMEYVRRHRYPAPEVFDHDGGDLVMERLTGDTMFAALQRRPWRSGARMRELAGLHDTLHAIPAPDWLAPARTDGTADDPRVLHLDLHPLNVMLTESGPVVIDWTNAAAGPPELDTALTYVLLSGARIGTGWRRAPIEVLRRLILRELRRHWLDDLHTAGHAAIDLRRDDDNIEAAEIDRMTAHLNRVLAARPRT